MLIERRERPARLKGIKLPVPETAIEVKCVIKDLKLRAPVGFAVTALAGLCYTTEKFYFSRCIVHSALPDKQPAYFPSLGGERGYRKR